MRDLHAVIGQVPMHHDRTVGEALALDDTAFGMVGVDAVLIDEGTQGGISVFPTSFDGERGPNDAEGYYTPIMSHGSHIYLAENTWAANTLTGNIAKITKDTHEQVDRRTTGTQSWVPGVGVAVAGHASAAVGVTGSGRVFTRRGGHAQALGARVEGTAGDLSTITTLSNPAGADVRADYRRFYRAPDGRLWLYTRGNDGKGELYFTDGAATLTRVGAPFGDYGSNTGAYGGNLAFGPGGVIYVVTEVLMTATSGFPGHFIGCARSLDNGASWQKLTGESAPLPLSLTDHTTVVGGTTGDKLVHAQITTTADGLPFIAFGWRNAGQSDTFLATWTARWSGSEWIYVRLFPAIGDGSDELGQWQNSKILPQVVTHNGVIYMVMKQVGVGVTQQLVLLANYPDEPPHVWHRWVLHNDDLYTGAYIDKHSLADDGLLRIYPVTSGDLVGYDQSSEIWEFVPADGS